jgi:hypothetical protein
MPYDPLIDFSYRHCRRDCYWNLVLAAAFAFD